MSNTLNKKVLANGLTIITSFRQTKTAALLVAVNVGSTFETLHQKGICHFVEHMVFEGTKKRNALEITSTIEGIGGEIGAYTTNERTCFYVKVLPKHLGTALNVLFDIIQNPVFKKESVEKERKVVINEINLKHDEPRFYQWELFMKTLFPNHPMSYPISGTKQSVLSIDRDKIIDFHKTYYMPNNMEVVYCGPRADIQKQVEKVFAVMKPGNFLKPKIRGVKSAGKRVVSRTMNQSYLILGYQTIPRKDGDSYALDVIRAILGKGLSGRIVDEIRTKKGLAYEVGCQHDAGIDYGLFAVYLSTQRKNLSLCESIIKRHLSKLEDLRKKELEEAKNFLEGEFVMETEDNHKYADALSFWDHCCLETDLDSYVKRIRAVTKQDVTRVSKKYFTNNYAIAVLQQKSG